MRSAPGGLDLSSADDAALERVARQTFRFFWEGAHAESGCARDRLKTAGEARGDTIATGATGFGIMAIVAAAERGWVGREAARNRITRVLAFLGTASRFHGAFPHFLDGQTGRAIPFGRRDDGADVVETAFLFQGLLTAREYFSGGGAAEQALRERIDQLWQAVEWRFFTRGESRLFWHWSPRHGWRMNHPVQGWNECLVVFVLAAGSPASSIDPAAYHEGFASGPHFRNGGTFHGTRLPLGPDGGGPLFFAHHSFCGLDPRGLRDAYADYWAQNVAQARINHAHCVANPRGHPGYGPGCWGLSASHGPEGYRAFSPARDEGVIAPSAALSSLPYVPEESLRALARFGREPRLWGRYGFVDGFKPGQWHARTYLGISQGPTVAMIENGRSGLLWRLFMAAPEVRSGLRRLGFGSPHLATGA